MSEKPVRTIFSCLGFLFLLTAPAVPGHALDRTVAVLDVTARNGGTGDEDVFSLKQALSVAGLACVVTDSLATATRSGMIITSSDINDSTFESAERKVLRTYVNDGGVLVAVNVIDPYLIELFGVTKGEKIRTRYTMSWQMDTKDPSLRYFDDPAEQTISFGNPVKYTQIFPTRNFGLAGGIALAKYDDGSNSVVKNTYGAGRTYVLGFSFTDVILRNELHLGYGAERMSSNGFEPTSDTIFLFLRAIYESRVPVPVWKHTSPASTRSSVIVTHDVDAQSSIAFMNTFADSELRRNLSTTYFITTRYINDAQDTDYFDPGVPFMKELVRKERKIGSHSVGHFPDFQDIIRFPEGAPGNTRESYRPYCDEQGVTTGGSVYGELEVSKLLLETTVGAPAVTCFRSGSLLFNKKLINVLDALAYRYDSSYNANAVLSGFPYLARYDGTFDGRISGVYEIPIALSDVSLDDTKMQPDNYPLFVQRWIEVVGKNAANSAMNILLIHPTYGKETDPPPRDYKLLAQQSFLAQLPKDIRVTDMAAFGDYWRERDRFAYLTEISDTTLTVTVLSTTAFPVHPDVGLYVRDGAGLATVVVKREDGTAAACTIAVGPTPSDRILVRFRLPGDVNLDGRVDIRDVIACLRMATNLDTPDPVLADFNADGVVDIQDVLLLLRMVI